MTERLHFHFSLSRIGEGNGNPLQCSCLDTPRDGGAWWAALYGTTQSRTRLKRLSSSSCILLQILGQKMCTYMCMPKARNNSWNAKQMFIIHFYLLYCLCSILSSLRASAMSAISIKKTNIYLLPAEDLYMEKAMETHSSVLAWRIPGMAEPGGLPSVGSHRVGHD